MENIFSLNNLKSAYEKIRKKRYNALTFLNIEKFEKNLDKNLIKLQRQVISGKYIPKTARGINILKKNNKIREISLMDLMDRIVQRTLVDYLAPIFDKNFIKDSYAYRKRKCCQLAHKRIDKLIKSNYTYILDADLTNYFGTINHNILLSKLNYEIKDKRILKLIKRYLQQIEYKDYFTIMQKGIKQGSIISPLFSNIYLNEFDHNLTKKGYVLIRYADDFIILTKSKEEVIMAYKDCKLELVKLELEFNKEKSNLINLNKGYSFKFIGEYFDINGSQNRYKNKFF